MVGCQDYDDQFAELTGLVNGLSTEVAGLSAVNASVAALSTTVSGLVSAVAAIPTENNTQAITDLGTALLAAQADIDIIEGLLGNVSSATALASLTLDLAAVQADVDTLLESGAVINQNVVIRNSATLEYASNLIKHAEGDPNVIINGSVTINTTNFDATQLALTNVIAAKLSTVLGNSDGTVGVDVTSTTSITFTNLGFIDAHYAIAGADMNDPVLSTVSGNLTIDHALNSTSTLNYSQISSVGGNVVISTKTHTYATSVNFSNTVFGSTSTMKTGVSDVNELVFNKATTVDLGTVTFSDLTANIATSVTSANKTFGEATTITSPLATTIDFNSVETATGLLTVSGNATAVIHLDKLKTATAGITVSASAQAHFPALETAGAALAITASAASDLSSLTIIQANSSIGGASVALTALTGGAFTLALPNATAVLAPALITGGVVTAPLALTVSLKSTIPANLVAVKATSLTITEQAAAWTSTTTDFPAVTSLNISGKPGTVTPLTNIAVTIAAPTVLTTVIVGGRIDIATIGGAALTSVTTTGTIGDLMITASALLATISINHDHIPLNTGSIISVIGAAKVSTIDMSKVSKVKSITLTGNTVLTTIVPPSATTLTTTATQINVDISGTNSLTGIYTNATAAIDATETSSGTAAANGTITSAVASAMKAWYTAATAGNTVAGNTWSMDLENVTYGATPTVGTIAAAWLADAVNLAKPDGVIAVSEHTGVINTATEISTIQ